MDTFSDPEFKWCNMFPSYRWTFLPAKIRIHEVPTEDVPWDNSRRMFRQSQGDYRLLTFFIYYFFPGSMLTIQFSWSQPYLVFFNLIIWGQPMWIHLLKFLWFLAINWWPEKMFIFLSNMKYSYISVFGSCKEKAHWKSPLSICNPLKHF